MTKINSPTQASSSPLGTTSAVTKLAVIGRNTFGGRGLRSRAKRWAIRLAALVVAVIVAWAVIRVVVGILTTDMWFDSVHAGSVYTTILETRILLFVVFAVVAALVGGGTLMALRRIGHPLEVTQEDNTFRWMFRRHEPRLRWIFVALAALIPAYLVGRQASTGWQSYLLWRHAVAWHQTDPHFHRDISSFVETDPFYRTVISLLTQSVSYGLWIAVIAGYWYGAWRIRGGRQKVTKGLIAVLSVLAAGYLILLACGYWLARYALTTSQRGPVTGPSFTDISAALPSMYVLIGLAAVAAAALLVNVARGGRSRVSVAVVVTFVIAAAAVGTAWPTVVYRFQESPSAAQVDLGEIARNLTATRNAFGLDGDVSTVGGGTSSNVDEATLLRLSRTSAQASVIDPNQLSPTFNVKQQLQAYYQFKSTLDISHYDLGGRSRDVALAARELNSSGVPGPTWVTNHLIYTHGYGVVAAPTTETDPATESPVFLNGGIPPGQQIPITRPQIYFGQAFGGSSYSIVGQPAGSHRDLEFDHPAGGESSGSAYTTYRGHGGIPIGSTWRRLLFAVQDRSANILFSSELNSASQLLTVRNPRARVAKVAPWLTLDGDVYPAIVNGQIKWIVDGYTSTNAYPNSQMVNLHSATSTTLTANGASVIQPNQRINYMRNSVKAVVDAYTGRVSLYSWDQAKHPDPLLETWKSVFPGLVQPQSSIPSALLPQLRYPTDLFNVQRSLLAKYHVATARGYYSGNDFWKVPTDPTAAAAQAINGKGKGKGKNAATVPLPSKYMSMSADGFGAQRYSLSTPMVTLNGRQLASFISVDSEPGPNYGKFTVLNFASNAGGESPSQVQNDIESDTNITKALTLQRGGNSTVVLGNLEAIPIAGRMLYVEPVYTQSNSSGSFPILRHVIALYANGSPSFENTLAPAIASAVRQGGGTG